SSFARDRDRKRDPAIAAISYLISQLPLTPFGKFTKDDHFDWHQHPFIFRAFKLAVAELLDALEPKGEIESRSLHIEETAADFKKRLIGTPFEKPGTNAANEFVATWKSPQSLANFAAQRVLSNLSGGLHSPALMKAAYDRDKRIRDLITVQFGAENVESFVTGELSEHEDEWYGMDQARRDLGPKTTDKKPKQSRKAKL